MCSRPRAEHRGSDTRGPKPKKCPRRESNPDLRFRKPSFYPLNYGDVALLNYHERHDEAIPSFASRDRWGSEWGLVSGSGLR